jgi:3-dehydroquinate dehydratase
VKTLENIMEITKRKGSRSYSECETFKKIEDGILDSIHNANTHQLNVILNGGYKFRYYTELNKKETIQSEVQRRIRESRLNQIL